MGLADQYEILPISYNLAINTVIRNHYLHRPAPCSVAFGLFFGEQLKGVICYGTPSSATLRSGIAGPDNAYNVIELTRLWVCDSVPKNGESFLIGRTLPKCGKEIVVSFAEIEAGHVGTVYQATNWIYTGLSAKRTNWTIKAEVSTDLFGDSVSSAKHCQTIADKFTASEIREKYGDDFSLTERPRKHRYIYLNARGKRKKQLESMLRYKTVPYPKRDS